MRLILSRDAGEGLGNMPTRDRRRLLTKLEAFAAEGEDRVRIRQGDWRGVLLIVREHDTVTLSRAEYESLLDRIEDAEDKAVIDRLEARIAKVGFTEATKDYLPIQLVERLIAGEHPIRV